MVRERCVRSFYSKLRETAMKSTSSLVHIFPSSSDVDSLCAVKIIFHILESDSIPFSSFPVSNFNDFDNYINKQKLKNDPITVVLINWGCHRDIRKMLNLGPSARIFVVDSHRPIHLRNLSDQNDAVTVLFTEEDEKLADLAYGFDFSLAELANASELLSDIEFEESESDSDSDSDPSESEGDSENDDVEGDGSRRRKKRKVSSDPVNAFKKNLKEYYRLGTFHGKPSGCLMYDLADSLRRNTNELLWLSCVSLTDQFVHERLSDERYRDGVAELEDHIRCSANLEPVTSVKLKDGFKIRAPLTCKIACEDEPRLMLLREWNLFDSMCCSSYVATKLKTWSDNGLKKLKLLLARMGFALVDCQQKFQYMNIEVKRKMKDEFERLLPEYGLTDFYYRSFLRMDGYSSRLSAADVVYGVTALLEYKHFNVALDALSLKHLDKLKDGMQHAIRIQRAVLRQGSTAITKNGCIRSGRKFRWLKLEDSADTALLGYPQALTKFCYFLMDALKEKGARMKPLVCACLSQEPNKVLIVGICGKPSLAGAQGNAFGAAFRNAAKEIAAEFFHDLFESSWIVLDSSAVNSFMVRLTEKL